MKLTQYSATNPVTGVAPWSKSNPPPVTVTGVAPWASITSSNPMTTMPRPNADAKLKLNNNKAFNKMEEQGE